MKNYHILINLCLGDPLKVLKYPSDTERFINKTPKKWLLKYNSENRYNKLFKPMSIRVIISFEWHLSRLRGSIIGDKDEKNNAQEL